MLPVTQAPVTQKMAGNKTTQSRETTVTSEETTTARAKTTSAPKPVFVTEADIKAEDVDGDYSKSGMTLKIRLFFQMYKTHNFAAYQCKLFITFNTFSIYSRPSLSRLRLSRITAYLKEKI